MSLTQIVKNYYYRNRYWIIKELFPSLLQNTSSHIKKDMTCTFYDDFIYETWRGIKWNIGEHWGAYNPDLPNVYFTSPILNKDSTASFICKFSPEVFNGKTIPYGASWLSTFKTFRQKYGRFECRMTLPEGKHRWPAFWMWGTTDTYQEVDIVEAYSKNTQEINIHWSGESLKPKKVKLGKYHPDEFIEFAFEWTPYRLTFLTNGIKVYEIRDRKFIEEKLKGPMWLMINNNTTLKNSTNYYNEFKVDYIRAYQFNK